MKLHRISRYFVSFRMADGYLLFALHWRWRFDRVRPAGKPGYVRTYIGPLEIERSKFGPPICAETGARKWPGNCWNVRCQLGGTCCRAPDATGQQECFPMLDPNVPEMGSRYPDKGCYRVGCPIHGGPGGVSVPEGHSK